jgi:3-phosphoshikimate 1-carboxyvinyltransferase
VPLPDLIEIVPLDQPVHAEITVPGSKSITNRALVLAALAEGEVALQGALWSEDTQVMVECLQELGFMVNVAPDPNETCNRTITVYGQGGKVPPGGTTEQPLELFVGNAGTAARFLAAMVCLGEGVYRLHGVPRMHERPQSALFVALRQLGYRIDSPNDRLPALIHGGSSRGNEAPSEMRKPESGVRNEGQSLLTSAATNQGKRFCTVSIQESSQFASALLMCARVGGWKVEVVGENAEESPYVAMTSEMVNVFPHGGGIFQIEPDASSGTYFWAARWLVTEDEMRDFSRFLSGQQKSTRMEWSYGKSGLPFGRNSTLSVADWPKSGWQVDAEFPKFLPLPDEVTRDGQLGDSIMMAIVLAADELGGHGEIERFKWLRFTELGRLRNQECERVVALRTELTKCGAHVREQGDMLEVWPSALHDAEIETHNDHRMAMCFAVLGLKVPGIKIKNPACVKKTFPNFFQKLATPPPHGLGATILDGHTGRKLNLEELFAD